MPNLLRWAKIAVDENHEELMRYTFSVLQTIGYQPPGEFKEFLQDILDLMFLSEKCKELSSKLFSLLSIADPENFVKGGPTLTATFFVFVFLQLMRGSKYYDKLAIIGTPTKRHFTWQADDGPTLNAGLAAL